MLTKVHAVWQTCANVDEWFDLDAALEAERRRREAHLGRLAMLVTVATLTAAFWLGWPGIEAVLTGQGAPLAALGVPALVLIFGSLVHDHASDDLDATARAITAASIVWPPLLFLAFREVEGSTLDRMSAGAVLLALACLMFITARHGTGHGFKAARYRALLTGFGAVLVASMWFGLRTDTGAVNDSVGAGVTLLAGGLAVRSWFIEDEHRGLRKAFHARLDAAERRLLELRASGRRVDQAASLIRTASAEGYADPEHGMRLLDDAEEDIDRTISLEHDVGAIEADARTTVDEAAKVAPKARKPQSLFDAARREVELGSLREGEALFRQAKRHAMDIITWWSKAEDAIETASLALSNASGSHVDSLRQALDEARRLMLREAPEKAHVLAFAIPVQLEAEAGALGDAEGVLREARRALDAADGLDLDPHRERLAAAEIALAEGDGRQAAGLAEGVRRSLIVEREAMDSVRRGLRQRASLEQRVDGMEDRGTWLERLRTIEEAAATKQWTLARRLMDDLTADLAALDRDLGEANQLHAFLREEWASLRSNAQSAGLGVGDSDRLAVERHLGDADQAIRTGATEKALGALSEADGAMERVRRRC
jgi:hypothetical protein